MTEKALNNLSEYLCDTLTDEEKRDLALELSMSSMAKEELPPYTMEEINAMIEESERQFASGRYMSSDEMFEQLEKKLEGEFCVELAETV